MIFPEFVIFLFEVTFVFGKMYRFIWYWDTFTCENVERTKFELVSWFLTTISSEVNAVKPKVEKLSDLHQQLEAKFAEKGSLLLTKINEKKFSKLAKEYLEWLASRKSQLGSSGRQQDISKADVIKSLLDEIQVLTLWLFFLLAFCWNKTSLIWL